MSIEYRLKCAVNKLPVSVTNLEGTNLRYFSNVIEASKTIGCNEKTIRRALNSNGILHRKYIWHGSIAMAAWQLPSCRDHATMPPASFSLAHTMDS